MPAHRVALAVVLALVSQVAAQQKSYRLPSVSIKEPILWGSACDGPDGGGLSFGGQDQNSDDGSPHTRIKVEGQWVAIHEDLWRDHPLAPSHRLITELAGDVRAEMVVLRAAYLEGKLTDESAIAPTRERWKKTLGSLAAAMQSHESRQAAAWADDYKARLKRAIAQLKGLADGKLPPHEPAPLKELAAWPALIAELHRIQVALEVGSSRVDLQACKLEYSIVSPK